MQSMTIQHSQHSHYTKNTLQLLAQNATSYNSENHANMNSNWAEDSNKLTRNW